MKKLITIALLLISSFVYATDYFVDAENGLDTNTGLSGAPWQTLSKVNSFSFPAGTHTVFFKRNMIWTGTLIVSRSNITFDAYGTGAKPLISGFANVTGWVNVGTNLWEAPVTDVKATVNMVTRNDVIQQVGRYPNKDAANGGYLTYTASTSTSITGSALSSVTNWTGAQVAIRQNRWTICKRTVTSHSAGTVNFSATSQSSKVNYGYFFQRDSRTLDQDGEWWYDATNSKLRVYVGNNNPSSYTYKISTIDTLLKNMNYYANVSIKNIAFEGANTHAIFLYSASGQLVQDCDVNYSGKSGIELFYCATSTVERCNVKNSLDMAIRNYNNDYSVLKYLTVKDCIIDSVAMIAGMENTNGQSGEGIECRGDSSIITGNSISNCGYGGIVFQGSKVSIRYNHIWNYGSVRDDVGGIYSYEASGSSYPTRTSQFIVSNIVHDAKGANPGTDNQNGRKANGIYNDEGSQNIIVDSNAVYNCKGAGLISNSSSYMTWRFNTLYKNTFSHLWERFQGAPLMRNLTYTNNINYPFRWYYTNVQIDQPTLITLDEDMLALGTMNNNYNYKGSGTDSSLFQRKANTGVTNYTEAFKNYAYVTGTILKEINSTLVNATNIASSIQHNATASSSTYNFSGLSKKDIYGNVYNNSVSIPAYGSIILLDNGNSIGNISPTANAGTDQTITITTATLSGSGTDADGTISSYAWTKLSGPAGGTITSPSSASTGITALGIGTYSYRLTVTDNGGATGFDDVNITVNYSLSPAVNPSNTVNGLDYKYYNGSWLALPDFTALVAAKTGTVTNVSLTPADSADYYGLVFEGYVNVPADNQYTFYTSSDDGSKLYIDGVQVVNNDGQHGIIEASGTIGLATGKHTFKVTFFESYGGQSLTVSYFSSGISKVTIPDGVLYRVSTVVAPTRTKGPKFRN